LALGLARPEKLMRPMAENPDNKEDKPDLFSPSGEALGYISLEQARVLAIRHARDNMDFYGPRYSGINLVWEVISQEDGEEYYDIRLSFRPAGRFRGQPGVEQFVIDKLGNIEYRQMLDEPTGLDLPETEQESPVSQRPSTPPQPTATPPTDAPATEPEPATPTITPPLTPDVVAQLPGEAQPDRASDRSARRRFLQAGVGLAAVAVVVGVLFASGVLPPGRGSSPEPVIVEKEVVREVPVEVVVEKEVVTEVIVNATPGASPAPASRPAIPNLVSDRLMVAVDFIGNQSTLDCGVRVGGTVMHRPSVEYLLDVDRFNGQIMPMLATEWEVDPDARTWRFGLRDDVQFHAEYGPFTALDVLNSFNYYTNGECRTGFPSIYFRSEPGFDLEILDDQTLEMRSTSRPAANLQYYLSAYQGLPISSKAQWDTGCPSGPDQYQDGYCAAGQGTVEGKPARTGPYQLVSYEEGVRIRYERVPYDHWRVNPDFQESDIIFVPEQATRMAIVLSGEGQIAQVERMQLRALVGDGLEVIFSSMPAWSTFMLFGGLYFDSSLAESYDSQVPWAQPGSTGRQVRMAMNKALDRDLINDAILDGLGSRQWVAALSPSFPGGSYPHWDQDWEELYGYDPERARQLLAEAGYPDGFEVQAKMYSLSGVPEMPQVIEAAAAMWEEIGLQTPLEETEYAAVRPLFINLQTQGIVYPMRSVSAPIDTRVPLFFSPERLFRAPATDSITAARDWALASVGFEGADRAWQEVADELYYQVYTMPLFMLPAMAVIDPNVVAEYEFLGPIAGGSLTSLEYVRAVRR